MYCPKCGHETNNCIPHCKVCRYYMSIENLNKEIDDDLSNYYFGIEI